MNQNSENGKKTNSGANFGPLGTNLGPTISFFFFFFLDFTSSSS